MGSVADYLNKTFTRESPDVPSRGGRFVGGLGDILTAMSGGQPTFGPELRKRQATQAYNDWTANPSQETFARYVQYAGPQAAETTRAQRAAAEQAKAQQDYVNRVRQQFGGFDPADAAAAYERDVRAQTTPEEAAAQARADAEATRRLKESQAIQLLRGPVSKPPAPPKELQILDAIAQRYGRDSPQFKAYEQKLFSAEEKPPALTEREKYRERRLGMREGDIEVGLVNAQQPLADMTALVGDLFDSPDLGLAYGLPSLSELSQGKIYGTTSWGGRASEVASAVENVTSNAQPFALEVLRGLGQATEAEREAVAGSFENAKNAKTPDAARRELARGMWNLNSIVASRYEFIGQEVPPEVEANIDRYKREYDKYRRLTTGGDVRNREPARDVGIESIEIIEDQ